MKTGKRGMTVVGWIALLFLIVNTAAAAEPLAADEPPGLVEGVSAPAVNTFQFTGAAVTKIPIVVPPGRAGLAPSLNLVYNSYMKNGWLGVGWSLDLGGIQRSTKRGVDYSADDFSSGGGELVPRSDWGVDLYGAKIESAFTRYRFSGSNGWQATTREGKMLFYGATDGSRLDNPDAPGQVFKWCLDRVEDPSGNYLSVEYHKDSGQIYPQRIDYTGHSSLAPYYAVEFFLEDRPDVIESCVPNFELLTTKRLKTIAVWAGTELVRAYGLEYALSPDTGRSLLVRIRQYGSDALLVSGGSIAAGRSLPQTVFEYQQDGGPLFTEAFYSTSHIAGFRFATKRDQAFPFDFNGDGRQDLFLFTPDSGLVTVARSNGDGTFSAAYDSDNGIGPFNFQSKKDQAFPFDFNGDGNSDLFLYQLDEDRAAVLESNSDGSFTTVVDSFNGMAGYRITSMRDRTFPFDFNGDGYADIFFYRLDSGGRAAVIRSNGDGTFTNVLDSTTGIAGFKFSTMRDQAFPFDYNGDGNQDLFFYTPDSGLVYIAQSNGDGTFSSAYSSTNGIGPFNFQSKKDRALAFDYNGDGRSDLFLYQVDEGRACVLRSNGDGTFTTVFNSTTGIGGYGLGHERDVVTAFDHNGDGNQDLFIYTPNQGIACVAQSNGDGNFIQAYLSTTGMGRFSLGGSTDRAFPFDFSGDGRSDLFLFSPNGQQVAVIKSGVLFPDLMRKVSNGLGGTTEISYTNSSGFENRRLPFIVHPVDQVTAADGLGGNNAAVTTYQYGGGLFDFAERDFRGFETVTQTGTDGRYSTARFHQDSILKGRTYQTRTWTADGQELISQSTQSWDSVPQQAAHFVRLNHKRTETYDDETVFSQEEYAYDDNNGHVIEIASSGTGAESLLKTHKYGNLGEWMWRLSQETLVGEISGQVRRTAMAYESGTGNMLVKESWLSDGENPRIETTYDEFGNPVSVTDPLGHVSTTTYDSETHAYPLAVRLPSTNGVDHQQEIQIDLRFGKPTGARDENGYWTYTSYDVFGRPLQTDYPDGGQTRITYRDDVFPRYVKVAVKEDEGLWTESFQYVDGFGRSVQRIGFGQGGKAVVTRYHYDRMGRNYKTVGPFFSGMLGFPIEPGADCPWEETEFDERGRPAKLKRPDAEHGNVTAFFSYSGLSVTATDPDGGSKTEHQDYLGRVIRVTEHGEFRDFETDYEYNAAGDLLRVIDAAGNLTVIDYDSLGRKVAMVDPDMGNWQYSYDTAGNLISQTDAKGQITFFEYDELNRLKRKYYASGDPEVTYTYDSSGAENGIGRLYMVENQNAKTIYEIYDPLGRTEKVTRMVDGAPKAAYTTAYIYDLSGKMISMIYPDNYQVNYAYYPGTGLLESVTGITDFTDFAEFDDYRPTGKMGGIYFGNGTATNYAYDPKSTRLSGIETLDPDLNPILKKSYRYSPAGDITEISEIQNGENITYTYAYDRQHRLISEMQSGANDSFPLAEVMPQYDDTAPIHAPKLVRYNGSAYGLTYDANGNLIAGPDFADKNQVLTRNIRYNTENMPVQIGYGEEGQGLSNSKPTGTGSARTNAAAGAGGAGGCWINTLHNLNPVRPTVNFHYDGEGARVIKQVQGGLTVYYVGEHFEVYAGVETKYIFAGNLRIAKVSGIGTHFFHKDHLGSSQMATDLPDGNVTETAGYLPFGMVRKHTGAVVSYYSFTDQELDAQIGLYNFNARLYDPVLGIFITPDSIIPDPFDPQTLNRYSYCRNNPLVYVDPSGHVFGVDDLIIGAVIGAMVGAVSAGMNDQNPLLGMAFGAITGLVTAGVFDIAGGLIADFGITNPISQAGIHAAAGAVSGGINSSITGGDIGMGMLTGAAAGGFGKFAGGYLPKNQISQFAGRTMIGGVIGGATSAVYGGDFGQGFALGAVTAAFSYRFNDENETHPLYQKLKAFYREINPPLSVKGEMISNHMQWYIDRSGIEQAFNSPWNPINYEKHALWWLIAHPIGAATGHYELNEFFTPWNVKCSRPPVPSRNTISECMSFWGTGACIGY